MTRSVPLLGLFLAAGAAPQTATTAQTTAATSVAECLAGGLPEKWKRLQVIIELPKPLAETGGVLYLVTLPDDRTEPFKPCDPRLPPVRLLDLREIQPEKERGWIKLILTMQPDASFNLKYEYPPKN